MQAVILAAGKSTRTYPLTLTKPKPLLKAANKTLLEHNMDILDGIANEAIIVVGYKKDMIKKRIGSKHKNIKIRYAEQKQQLGTGDALLKAERHIKDEFISLHADDIYSKKDLKNILKNKYSILVKEVNNPKNFGVVIKKKGFLADLIEKPQKFTSNLANTGLYKLDRKIFPCIKKTGKSGRGEYELTDAIRQLARREKICCVKSTRWIPIGYPSDLLKADRALRKNNSIKGKNSKIHGTVKNSSIGDDCTISGNISNSIIMDGAIVDKNSAVENSIIGENVHFSGKVSNAVIADNSKIKNSVIKNCKIWPNKRIENKNIEHDVQ